MCNQGTLTHNYWSIGSFFSAKYEIFFLIDIYDRTNKILYATINSLGRKGKQIARNIFFILKKKNQINQYA